MTGIYNRDGVCLLRGTNESLNTTHIKFGQSLNSGCTLNMTPMLYYLFFIYMFSPERQMTDSWKPSRKQYCFGNRVALDRNVYLFRLRKVNVKKAGY
jgi:hypothetical protein